MLYYFYRFLCKVNADIYKFFETYKIFTLTTKNYSATNEGYLPRNCDQIIPTYAPHIPATMKNNSGWLGSGFHNRRNIHEAVFRRVAMVKTDLLPNILTSQPDEVEDKAQRRP